jgi:hypothetical protein
MNGTVKQPWQYQIGERVCGEYYGHKFEGTISRIRQNSANYRRWHITVQLDAPAVFFGCETRDLVVVSWGESHNTIEAA